MPELPEVETARRGIERAMKGKTVSKLNITRTDLRVPVTANMADALQGKKCTKLLRRGKYIIIEFSGNKTAILHLGMSGRIRIYDPKQTFEQQKHDHIILTLHDSTTIVFHDPRRFGFFYLSQEKHWQNEKSFLSMGPEPLEQWAGADLHQALCNKKTPIKQSLLDQAVVAGLGNIYVSEALHCAAIHPERISNTMTKKESEKIVSCSKKVLEKAILAGGSTLRDYQQTDGSLGYFQYQFSVYDREGVSCARRECSGTIKRIVQSGRSTFYCPDCQK